MILGVAALLLGAQGSGTDGAVLIGKMFAYYASATSMSGTIHMSQSVQNVSVGVDTTVAYQAPSKLYFKQVLNAPTSMQWLVTSDGTSFTYDYPNDQRKASSKPETSRLWESVSPINGVRLDFRQIFRAASRSLGDLSFPEFVAIAGPAELQAAKDQIATIIPDGTETIGGQTVIVLKGDWRIGPRTPVTGKYKMYITPDGQLKRFMEVEMVDLKLQSVDSKPQTIVTTWDVDLHPNSQSDPSLFTVVK